MLSDNNTYKELKRDPAPALERKMNDKLISLKKKSGSLPLPINIRPIVSFINSPTYNISKYLVTVLSPMVAFVKNSKEFTGFISSQTIETGWVLVSFDVTSLFT